MPRLTALAPVTSLLRHLPLFFAASPRTPLRVLCIVALDALHVLRHEEPLPRRRIELLATLLDFQAATNAVWDRKPSSAADRETLRRRLEQEGLAVWVGEYLGRVGELESRRPAVGGGTRRFAEVRAYREAVVRLSLAVVAGAALNHKTLDEAIQATYDDSVMAVLFRMAMQCQVIDDVLDYGRDLAAGLPGFLTASVPPAQSVALTAVAVRCYRANVGESGNGVFCLRVAHVVLSAIATLAVHVAAIRLHVIGLVDRRSAPGAHGNQNVKGGPTLTMPYRSRRTRRSSSLPVPK